MTVGLCHLSGVGGVWSSLLSDMAPTKEQDFIKLYRDQPYVTGEGAIVSHRPCFMSGATVYHMHYQLYKV